MNNTIPTRALRADVAKESNVESFAGPWSNPMLLLFFNGHNLNERNSKRQKMTSVKGIGLQNKKSSPPSAARVA
jgi:hypothetical protein